MKTIKITIASEEGNGKTTFANHLKTILHASGFQNVKVEDIDGPLSQEDAAKRFSALINIQTDVEIVIDTKQLVRSTNIKGNGNFSDLIQDMVEVLTNWNHDSLHEDRYRLLENARVLGYLPSAIEKQEHDDCGNPHCICQCKSKE